jgi:hypothetical protein
MAPYYGARFASFAAYLSCFLNNSDRFQGIFVLFGADFSLLNYRKTIIYQKIATKCTTAPSAA